MMKFALVIFLFLCCTISLGRTHVRRKDMSSHRLQRPTDATMSETVTVSKRGFLDGILPSNRGNRGGSGLVSGILQGIPKYDACTPDGPIPESEGSDAPFTQGINSLTNAVVCRYGTDGPRGVVLAIPCTSCGGDETYAGYATDLFRLGFSLCWLELPTRSTGDIQLTAEFVAFGVQYVASKSPEGVVNLLTYSQGGVGTQYFLTSWPSLRKNVKQMISLAAPFKGTLVANSACDALAVAGGCSAALYEMRSGSRFINALNSRQDEDSGAQALVPTTSIFTLEDELVVPQSNGPNGASFLEGAVNIAIQEVCSTTTGVDHFQIILNSAAYGLVLSALQAGKPTGINNFDRRFCGKVLENLVKFGGDLVHDVQLGFRAIVGNPDDRLSKLTKTLTTLQVESEPLLQPHMCARGYADPGQCLSRPGFCEEKPSEPVLGGKGLPSTLKGVTKLLGQAPSGGKLSSLSGVGSTLKGILGR